MRNPWNDQLIQRERSSFANNEGEMAGAYAEAAYAERFEPKPCECGEQAWYKSTIGCYKCPACGGLMDSHGDPIR